MSEFVFRNLSVKLLAADDGPVCICCSYEYQCNECSQCTDSPTAPPCDPCTQSATVECGECTNGPTCDACTAGDTGGCEGPTDDCFPCTDFEGTGGCLCSDTDRGECEAESCMDNTGCFNTITIFVEGDAPSPRSSDQILGELNILRDELRRTLGVSEEAVARVPRRRPSSVEEIDQFKAELLDAVAELDQQRAELESS
jgi:hypothetical protein